MKTNTIVNVTEDKINLIKRDTKPYTEIGKQTNELLSSFNTGEDASIFDFTIEQAREIFNPIFQSCSGQHLAIAENVHRTIEFGGLTIPLVELTPKGDMPADGWPVLLFIHGGGWILGDYPSYEGLAKSCCYYTAAKVIFVDYALSPEEKYPLALQQISASLKWLFDQQDTLNINPNSIGIIGDSAGGNLAAALCLLNQQSKEPLPIKMQCLLYPFIDLSLDTNYPSRKTCGDGQFFLSRDHITWSRNHYLTKSEQSEEVFVSPIKANNLEKLPNTIIVSAGFDPLQDEAKAYHQKLINFGNKSVLIHFPSTIHGFLSFPANLDIANTGIKHICHEIKANL